jgi:nucleoside-diphosphate-sugar epimerase
MIDWSSRRVLVTGGLGFIGSNLAHGLVERGADVTVFDAQLPKMGSNPANVAEIRDDVTVVEADVRDEEAVAEHVREADVVYHCAAQLSRIVANEEPQTDIDINCKGLINVLHAADSADPSPHVVFTSSLAVFGRPESVPVDESTPTEPIDMYGANKRAGEHYCRIYEEMQDVPTTVVRPANVYGPRAPLTVKGYGVQNQFVAGALRAETLTVFEPGTTLRDYVYVGDVVDALVRLGRDERAYGEAYVLGSGEGTTLKELANATVNAAQSGDVELVPWPDEWDKVRRGDVVTDPSKLASTLGWEPTVDLATGLRETVEFYRARREDYLED